MESTSSYEVVSNTLSIKTRTDIDMSMLIEIVEDTLHGKCPSCWSDNFYDGDVICNKCFEKAIEEREKYR